MGKKDWMRGCFILMFVMSLYGCATTEDVRILDREIYRLNSQLNTLQKEKDSLKTEVQKEIPALKTDLDTETKKLQADLLLRVEALQSQIRTLSTDVEEYKEFLKRPSKEIERVREDIALRTRTLEERDKTFEEKNRIQEDRIRTIEERIKRIEDQIKRKEDQIKMLGGKIDQVASKQIEEEKTPRGEAPVDVRGLSTGAGDLYKDAYETFQKGDLERARRKFEAFLKQYPNTELSDNAQFWIGETYYLKKDFEKAILEYEKAITKYPEGDKIPAALFKQALAFLELGEKSSAKDLLKRVIERYPNSDQAEMAKKKLEAIK
jgi:tol-pal system protein YbgF